MSSESAHQEITLSRTGGGGIACTWAPYEKRTSCHSGKLLVCILRPCGHNLLRAFASVYNLSWSVRNELTEITIPTAVYGVEEWTKR